MQAEVIIQQAVQALELKQALRSSALIARTAQQELAAQPEIEALGLEILGVSVMAVKPTPDIARALEAEAQDRKSTRLNSSHSQISYAVFCLKKKKKYI